MALQSDDGGPDETDSDSSSDGGSHGSARGRARGSARGRARGRGRGARGHDVRLVDLVAEPGWQKMDEVDPTYSASIPPAFRPRSATGL